MSDDRRIVYKPWADNIDDPTNEVRVPFTGAPQSICGLTLGSEHRVGILDWSDTKATIIDPTVLTPAILAALGFTYTRTGEVYGRRAPGGPGNYVRHATNEPELDFTEVDGKNYPSLIVRGAATPLISYSADLTNAVWTKANCTAELVTGSLESATAPNAHSLVTATGANATVTRQLTRASANRNTRWKIKAPSTNSGDVKVSQDNGSTSITLTPGEFADIELGEQTSANPTIWLQLTDDGDTVEHYDVQMAELAAGTPVPNFVPQWATPAAVGVASVARTSVDLAGAYDVDALVVFHGVANSYVMQHVDTLSDFFEIYMTSAQRAVVRVREGGGTTYSAVSPSSTFVDGEVVKISGTYSGGDIDLLKDDVSVDTETGATDPDGVGVVYLGHAYSATGFANTHIIAIRDNEGTILGEAGKGFNLGALEHYEASL